MKKSKKTFKRVLCVALAAIMVGSSFPIASFANGKAGNSLLDLNAAINSYTTVMNKGVIYKNMKPAYDAYIKALEIGDVVVYGVEKNTDQPVVSEQDIVAATKDLNDKIAAMTKEVWDPNAPVQSVTPSFKEDGTKGTSPTTVYKAGNDQQSTHNNLIYSPKCSSSVVYSKAAPDKWGAIITRNSKNVDYKILYAPSVLIYDGVTDPRIPVMSLGNNQNRSGDERWCYGAYPSNGSDPNANNDNKYFSLDSQWRGTYDSPNGENDPFTPNKMDFLFNFANGDRGDGSRLSDHLSKGSGYDYATTFTSPSVNLRGAKLCEKGYSRYMSNTMSFKYQMLDTEYIKSFGKSCPENIPWCFSIAGGNSPSDEQSIRPRTDKKDNFIYGENIITGDPVPIYVINTAVLKKAINNAVASKVSSAPSIKINSKSFSTLLGVIDEATNYSVSSADFQNLAPITSATNEVGAKANQKANEIKDLVTRINAAAQENTNPDPSDTGYQKLREAITESKPTFSRGDRGYKNWAGFETEYKNAVAHIKKLNNNSNGYIEDSIANDLADKLIAAYNALEPKVPKVNTDILEGSIDNALVINVIKNFLITSDTCQTDLNTALANLSNTVNTAKTNVWHDAQFYKVKIEKLDADAEGKNQAIVDNEIELISKALSDFAINFDSAVPAAGNKSMNALLEEAKAIDPNKYSNYAQLDKAIQDAETFKNTTKGLFESVRGNVKTRIQQYVNYTKELQIAIFSLQPAFSDMGNGTIINVGNPDGFELLDHMQEPTWSVKVDYRNEMAIFRTTHDTADFNLGTFGLQFSSRSNDWAQALDSINIDDKADHNDPNVSGLMHKKNKDGWGEITSDGSGDQSQMDVNQTNLFKGGLQITNKVGDTTGNFKITDIHVTSTPADVQGRIPDPQSPNGHRYVAKDENFNWAPQLEKTDGIFINDDISYSGGVLAPELPVAKGAEVRMVANQIVSLPAVTAMPLSQYTVPSEITFAPQSTYFGAVVKYKITTVDPTGLIKNTYQGYGHDRKQWSPSLTVIDVSYLFDLIKASEDILKNSRTDYTQAAINNLNSALTNAKKELLYGKMTTADVTTECKDRYSKLWTAYSALETSKHVCNDLNDFTAWTQSADGVSHERTCNYCGKVQKALCAENLKDYADPIAKEFKAPTANNPGYIYRTSCKVCNRVVDQGKTLDIDAYLAAEKESIDIRTKDKAFYEKAYTEESRIAYEKAVNEALLKNLDQTSTYIGDGSVTINDPQAVIINSATSKILEAKKLLNKILFKVKFVEVLNGVEQSPVYKEVETKYGDIFTADATPLKGNGYIANWTVVDNNANSTTQIYRVDDVLPLTITSDTTIYVNIAEKPVESQAYTKVTLYKHNGLVYNISYVDDMSKIDVSKPDLGLGITPPSVPFRTFDCWVKTTSANGEANYMAKYLAAPSNTHSQIIGVGNTVVNGLKELSAEYDSLLTLTGATKDQMYAIVNDNSATKVISYLNSDTIHVPHRNSNDTLYISIVDKNAVTLSTGVTGALIAPVPNDDTRKLAEFNCMFYAPTGFEVLEYGAVGTFDPNAAASDVLFRINEKNVYKYQSDTCSASNEYTIAFKSKFKSGDKFYGRSYVTYKTGNSEPVTIYGNVEEIAF